MPTGKIRNSLVFEALRKFSLLLGYSSEILLSPISLIVSFSDQHMESLLEDCLCYQIKHEQTTRKKSVQVGNP